MSTRADRPEYNENHNRGTSIWESWVMRTQLQRGRLGPKARHVFTRGHCHSFALAVCEIVPGAVAHFVRNGSHVVAKLPDGRVVDANGVMVAPHLQREIPADWDWAADCYKLPRTEEAIPFAETMLAGLP